MDSGHKKTQFLSFYIDLHRLLRSIVVQQTSSCVTSDAKIVNRSLYKIVCILRLVLKIITQNIQVSKNVLHICSKNALIIEQDNKSTF